MNKINTRLLTVFLICGILFFLGFVFLLISKEAIPGKKQRSVNVKSIKLIRNDYGNAIFMDSLKSNEAGEQVAALKLFPDCQFNLVNQSDLAIYASSEDFKLETCLPPKEISFLSSSLIPQSTLGDKFNLVLMRDRKIFLEIPMKSIKEETDTKTASYDIYTQREIKLA
jgi:hypothetical protein